MFLKTMGVLSTIQLRGWGFVHGVFVLGGFVLGGFCPYPGLQVRSHTIYRRTSHKMSKPTNEQSEGQNKANTISHCF